VTRAPARKTASAEDVAAKFRLIGDPTRLAILDELSRGECCVCDLVDILGVAQPLLSHHLRALRDAGLVKDRKDGRWAYYSLVQKTFEQLQGALRALTVPKPPGRRRDCT
jgi:ArsR family transcriptional regulator